MTSGTSTLNAIADQLAPELDRRRLADLHERLSADAPVDWRAVAAIAALALRDKRCVGLSGGQGAGKSTLAALIAQALALVGRGAAVCSLDDFYLDRRERSKLAREVHPLLATRGPPGTHDVALALAVLDDVLAGRSTRLPRFDKGRDEPCPRTQWPVAESESVDRLVFEGWCLGVEPQPEAMLRRPVNWLEAEEDRDGRWRAYVNAALRRLRPALATGGLVDLHRSAGHGRGSALANGPGARPCPGPTHDRGAARPLHRPLRAPHDVAAFQLRPQSRLAAALGPRPFAWSDFEPGSFMQRSGRLG